MAISPRQAINKQIQRQDRYIQSTINVIEEKIDRQLPGAMNNDDIPEAGYIAIIDIGHLAADIRKYDQILIDLRGKYIEAGWASLDLTNNHIKLTTNSIS